MGWWDELHGEAFPSLLDGFLAVLGAIAGSFASAAIHRIPDPELTISRPRRSFCPACGCQLRWQDNLPILSYVLLRGRCRSCGKAFGPGYLANELVLMVLFVVAGRSWAGEGPLSLALVVVALTALWIATVIDWKHLILPDGITLGGIPYGIVAALLVPQLQGVDPAGGSLPWIPAWLGMDPATSPMLIALVSSIGSAAIAFGAVFVLRLVFSYLLRQEALGFGDVKFLAAVGALVGLEGAVWTLLIGVLVGALLGVANIVRMVVVVGNRRHSRGRSTSLVNTVRTGWLLGRRIPFGPPLVLGTMIVLLAPGEARALFLDVWPRILQEWMK